MLDVAGEVGVEEGAGHGFSGLFVLLCVCVCECACGGGGCKYAVCDLMRYMMRVVILLLRRKGKREGKTLGEEEEQELMLQDWGWWRRPVSCLVRRMWCIENHKEPRWNGE